MVSFLCKLYKKLMDVIAILLLVISTISGYVVGLINDSSNIGNGILGAILGFIICFILELLIIPPITILFSIDSRLENIENKKAM